MLTAHRHALTLRALARVLASWLAAIVLLQGWAAAEGLVRGALHVHAPAQAQTAGHEPHAHADWQRHLHAHDGTGMLPAHHDDGEGIGAAGLLALCFAAALFATWRMSAGVGAHAPPLGSRIAFLSHHPLPPDRPPRG